MRTNGVGISWLGFHVINARWESGESVRLRREKA